MVQVQPIVHHKVNNRLQLRNRETRRVGVIGETLLVPDDLRDLVVGSVGLLQGGHEVLPEGVKGDLVAGYP